MISKGAHCTEPLCISGGEKRKWYKKLKSKKKTATKRFFLSAHSSYLLTQHFISFVRYEKDQVNYLDIYVFCLNPHLLLPVNDMFLAYWPLNFNPHPLNWFQRMTQICACIYIIAQTMENYKYNPKLGCFWVVSCQSGQKQLIIKNKRYVSLSSSFPSRKLERGKNNLWQKKRRQNKWLWQ